MGLAIAVTVLALVMVTYQSPQPPYLTFSVSSPSTPLSPSSSSSGTCPLDKLVVYSLKLETFWSEDTFPKQYPQWRPTAQWSKTVGYSHSDSLTLYREGFSVGEAVRQFVEKADTDMFDREAANLTFLDAVVGPPIVEGVGTSESLLFVDGSNTLISVMTKIVPSPDWFVGLDSVQLCREGVFLDNLTTEAFPMDAGTDNGFTFTSPNWETDPRAEVFTISNTFPAHPAGSFNYPNLDKLPTLAVYTLTKKREYTLTEEFQHYAPATTKHNTGETKNNILIDKYKYDVVTSKNNGVDVFEFVPVDLFNKTIEYEIEEKKKSSSNLPHSIRHIKAEESATKAPKKPMYVEKKEKDNKNNLKHTHLQTHKVISANVKLDSKGNGNSYKVLPVSIKDDNYHEIISNEIPEASLMKLPENPFSSGNKLIEFLPVEVTTKRRANKIQHNKALSGNWTDEDAKIELLVANRNKGNSLANNNQIKGFRNSGYHASTSQDSFFKKKYKSRHLALAEKKVFPSSLSTRKGDLFQQILASYNNNRVKGQFGAKKSNPVSIKKKKRKLRKQKHNKRKRRNCKVSKWSPWGVCNKTCGIGESVRTRTVTQYPRRSGLPCPTLKDYKWCGSARNCKTGYFRW